MPDGLTPPGYRAVLIGSAATIEELSAFAPMEEGTAEGSLMLMRLDFADFPTGEALAELEGRLQEAGVERWPGYPYIVYAETAVPSVYLAWQKGITWLPVILGILAVTLLPPLLLAGIWLILPESVKALISGLVNLGMMALVFFLLIKMMPALMPARERPKEIEERAG